MSIFGKAWGFLARTGDTAAFRFIADLAWEMLKAQKTNLEGADKLAMVLSWVSKLFPRLRGERYEELITEVTALIAIVKKVVKLIRLIKG